MISAFALATWRKSQIRFFRAMGGIMKSVTCLGVLFFLFSLNVVSGATLEEMFQSDKKISLVKEGLPKGWELVFQESSLICQRTKEISTMMVNRINAPATFETPEQKKKRFETLGRKTILRIILRVEPKWSAEKKRETKEINDSLNKKIGELISKFHLEKLFHSSAARKGLENAYSDDPREKQNLQEYRIERSELEKNVVKLPDFDSEKFSLFFDKSDGYDDEFHESFPPESLQEMREVKSLLEKSFDLRR